MIDTNVINQASLDFAVVKQQVQVNWTAIAIAATFAGRELGRFNAWCVGVSEFVIKHGGFAWLVWKLIWNPPVTVVSARVVQSGNTVGGDCAGGDINKK